MAIDRADWHVETAEQEYREEYGITGQLTEEQIKEIWLLAANHIGLFMRWLIERGFEGEEANTEDCLKVLKGDMTGAEYLMKNCDGKLWDEDVRADILPFVHSYYNCDGECEYLSDYIECCINDEDKLLYRVFPNEDDYNDLKHCIDAAYEIYLEDGGKKKKGLGRGKAGKEEPAKKGGRTLGKRILLILASIIVLLCDGMWFLACVFASGQLYDSYEMWKFFIHAPIATLILLVLLALSVFLFVLAVKRKK